MKLAEWIEEYMAANPYWCVDEMAFYTEWMRDARPAGPAASNDAIGNVLPAGDTPPSTH